MGMKVGMNVAVQNLKSKFSNMEVSSSVNERNIETVVNTLCHLRGAALKIGQIISIQDNEYVPKEVQEIFAKVRQNADYMPFSQVQKVLIDELGINWREKFKSFDENPSASASIGQVHCATTLDDKEICIKVQYPDIHKSIDNDIQQFLYFLHMTNILPEGLYAESLIEEARKELRNEVDYEKEASSIDKFRKLLKDDKVFYVPKVYHDLSTKRVLTMERIKGKPVDQFINSSNETKKFICTNLLSLTLKELFDWHFMQTDPNWSNFFYDESTKKINLIDFGACKQYSLHYVSRYFKIIECAKNQDSNGILHWSKQAGFFTGFETQAMEQAHINAVLTLGEPFRQKGEYDFSTQDITSRLKSLISVMMHDRLKPPPKESYTLHRKMSGIFLLCYKLKVSVDCNKMYDEIIAPRSPTYTGFLINK